MPSPSWTRSGAAVSATALVALLRDPAGAAPVVVDLRPAERFARLHVRGSVSLPPADPRFRDGATAPADSTGALDALAVLATLAVLAEAVPPGRRAVVVAASRTHAEALVEGLRRCPLPGVGVLLGGVGDVADAGGPVVRPPPVLVRLARRARRAAALAAARAADAGRPR